MIQKQAKRHRDLKKILCFVLCIVFTGTTEAASDPNHSFLNKAIQHSRQRIKQIWDLGKNELNIPVYVWHNRFTYTDDKIQQYNEIPWGGGLGKSFYDEEGDWHGLYAFAFLDSHKNVEPIVGYGFEKMLHITERTAVGAGYTALITSRTDVIHSIPFPGILPLVAVVHQRASLTFIYVPSLKSNVGNVLFVLAKWVIN